MVNYACIATLKYYGGSWTADSTWRFALAFGCAANLLTLWWRYKMVESHIYTAVRVGELAHKHVHDMEALTDEQLAEIAKTVDKNAVLSFRESLQVLWEVRLSRAWMAV